MELKTKFPFPPDQSVPVLIPFVLNSQRLKESRTNPPSFGNSFYRVQLDPEQTIDSLPLFGAKYLFKLEGVVDAWEYLVYLPLLIK